MAVTQGKHVNVYKNGAVIKTFRGAFSCENNYRMAMCDKFIACAAGGKIKVFTPNGNTFSFGQAMTCVSISKGVLFVGKDSGDVFAVNEHFTGGQIVAKQMLNMHVLAHMLDGTMLVACGAVVSVWRDKQLFGPRSRPRRNRDLLRCLVRHKVCFRIKGQNCAFVANCKRSRGVCARA